MDLVRKKILEEWSFDNDGDNNITKNDLERLYNLYDKYAFYGGIKEHISRKQNIKITFGFSQKDNPTARYCGITKYVSKNKEITLNLELSEWITSRIRYATRPYLLKLTGMSNNPQGIDVHLLKYAYLQAFEHQLTHLLFYLWGHCDYQDTEKNIHGNLFNCVYVKFFETSIDIVQNMMISNGGNTVSASNFYPQPLIMKKSFYEYHENSCYLDSLLTLLLFTKSNVFRNVFFTTNLDTPKYKNLPSNIKTVCSDDSDIKTFKSFGDFAKGLQSELFHDYMRMFNSKNNTECREVRNLLSDCLSDLHTEGSWDIYNVSEIYDFITNIFPVLKGDRYPYVIIPHSFVTYSEPKSMFTFWEFMEIPDVKEIMWMDIDNDILVFRNGGVPAITNFGSISSEDISIPKRDYGSREESPLEDEESPLESEDSSEESEDSLEEIITINKSKAFGKTILDNKYEMVGAIMLNGVKPGKSGGVHYTAYVKTLHGGWYFFNDIGPVWKNLTNFQRIYSLKKEV
jgi:hypothetical protein